MIILFGKPNANAKENPWPPKSRTQEKLAAPVRLRPAKQVRSALRSCTGVLGALAHGEQGERRRRPVALSHAEHARAELEPEEVCEVRDGREGQAQGRRQLVQVAVMSGVEVVHDWWGPAGEAGEGGEDVLEVRVGGGGEGGEQGGLFEIADEVLL